MTTRASPWWWLPRRKGKLPRLYFNPGIGSLKDVEVRLFRSRLLAEYGRPRFYASGHRRRASEYKGPNKWIPLDELANRLATDCPNLSSENFQAAKEVEILAAQFHQAKGWPEELGGHLITWESQACRTSVLEALESKKKKALLGLSTCPRLSKDGGKKNKASATHH